MRKSSELHTCCIYQIINTANGKRYIGQSENALHRKNCHFYELKHGKHKNQALQNDYLLSPDSFVFEILAKCGKTELDELEKYYIQRFKTNDREHGYNIESGGTVGATASYETKQKMSLAKIGNTSMCGLHLSEEWKKNLSLSQPHKKRIRCIETNTIYESFADAARETGLNRTKIVSVCTGKRKTTGGYHFCYADAQTSG